MARTIDVTMYNKTTAAAITTTTGEGVTLPRSTTTNLINKLRVVLGLKSVGKSVIHVLFFH